MIPFQPFALTFTDIPSAKEQLQREFDLLRNSLGVGAKTDEVNISIANFFTASSAASGLSGLTAKDVLYATGASTVGQDNTFNFTAATHLLSVNRLAVTLSDISMTGPAIQQVIKSGGSLYVGTSDANELRLLTNNIAALKIDSAGDVLLPLLPDGLARVTGNILTVNALTTTNVLFALSASTVGQDSTFSFDSGTHVLTFQAATFTGSGGGTAFLNDANGDLDKTGANLKVGTGDAHDVRLYVNNVSRLRIDGATANTFHENTPYFNIASGTGVAQSAGTVIRFSQTPPNVASAAGATLDAHRWDAATVTVTGTTNITTATGFNFIDVEQPTYQGASSVNVTNAATFTIKGGPIGSELLTFTNNYSLWLQNGGGGTNDQFRCDPIATFTNTILMTEAGAQSINKSAGTALQIFAQASQLVVIGDTTGGSPAFQAKSTTGDGMCGLPSLAPGATAGYPYMPSVAGRLTGTPTMPFTNGAPHAFDKSHNNLSIWNANASAWNIFPAFNASTATPGAQTSTLTNLPTAVVSTTPKWEIITDGAGVTTYRPFWQ